MRDTKGTIIGASIVICATVLTIVFKNANFLWLLLSLFLVL